MKGKKKEFQRQILVCFSVAVLKTKYDQMQAGKKRKYFILYFDFIAWEETQCRNLEVGTEAETMVNMLSGSLPGSHSVTSLRPPRPISLGMVQPTEILVLQHQLTILKMPPHPRNAHRQI